MNNFEQAKTNVAHLEKVISDYYFKIATLEAELIEEKKYLQSVCPHLHLIGHSHCEICGLWV